jgi:hypothetical protein
LVEQGLKLASKQNLRIIANFRCNYRYLKEYCKLKKYHNIFWHCHKVTDSESVLKLLSFENAVIILDEAGLALFSRGFKDSTRTAIFHEMFQVRKGNSIILYSCQYLDQVDKQLRDNTQLWIITKGFQYKRRLYTRSQLALDRENFKRLVDKPELMTKMIYPIFLAKFRYTYSILLIGKIIGFVNHLKKAFKYAHEYSKDKPFIVKLFWELEGIEKYFKAIEYLSDEDLLFKVYNSFEKVNAKQRGIFKNSPKNYGTTSSDETIEKNGKVNNLEWLKHL